jgi:hypothetical protein
VDYAVNSYAREFLLSLTELDRKHLLFVEEALNRMTAANTGIASSARRCRPEAPGGPALGSALPPLQELEEKGLPQFPFQVGTRGAGRRSRDVVPGTK